ncbi:MAG: 50S ribosomal protein L18, partial [Candidatus Electrothrix sp. AW5]|nr:50S ribosomal protein L18 [Candidatus Electrothrix gigas]
MAKQSDKLSARSKRIRRIRKKITLNMIRFFLITTHICNKVQSDKA